MSDTPMEIRLSDGNKVINLNSNSNSMSAFVTAAESLLHSLERRADNFNALSLDPKDQAFLLYLREELQEIGERLSGIDSKADAAESETELRFFYDDHE